MLFTLEQIQESSKAIAPSFGFEAPLITAIAKQECMQRDGLFDASVSRLEQNFYSLYVEKKLTLASTVEAQFATSWGVWQIMGLSLYELKFFEWYFNTVPSAQWKQVLKDPLSPLTVTEALNWFAGHLNSQCEYACKHLATKREKANKLSEFKGEKDKQRMMLLLWNGGGDPQYDDKVLSKVG